MQRGWVGIQLTEGKHGGVIVEDIVPGSPASQSELKAGDEILAVDGAEVHAPRALSHVLGGTPIGKKVSLTVLHDGGQHAVVVAPAARPPDEALVRTRLMDRPAPEFSLARVNGAGADTVAAHRGKLLLVDFWATWCGPCLMTLPHLAKLAHRHAGKVDVVGISTESSATLLRGITELGIGHTILRDSDEKATVAYGVSVLPTMVLVDAKGVVRHVEVGANVEGMETALAKLLAEHP